MLRPLCLLLVLAACNTPGPYFDRVPATRVEVADMVFDIRVRGDLAQAMRLNPQWAPRLDGVAGPAARAMAEVSGCRVTGIRGDQALMLGSLDCGDGRARRVVPVASPEFDCYVIDRWKTRGLNQRTTVLDCDPAL
jgi:hypothetical protein